MIDSFIPISTKIRPVKKIYIIDNDDINSFFEIVQFSTTEIDGIFNLIFTVDQLKEASIDILINNFYPDIIINFSKKDTNYFDYLNKEVVDNKGRLHFLKTDLCYWNMKPNELLSSILDHPKPTILYNSLDEINNENIVNILEYGILDKNDHFFDMFDGSIFRHLKLQDVRLDEKVDLEQSTSILEISDYFSSSSVMMDSRSNPNNYFSSNKGKVLIIGSVENLNSLLYFWNERALHHSKNIKFLTPSEIEENSVFKGFKYYVNFSDRNNINLTDENGEKIREIENNYYFDGKIIRWANYWHYSYAKIENGYIEINHPVAKSFSIFGVQNVMMEISGINECFLPNNHKYSDIFIKEIPKNGDYRFTSNSDNSISVFEHIFNLEFSDSDIYSKVYLPQPLDILQQFEKINNIRLETTKKTILFNNLQNSINNSKVFDLIRNKEYFDLIVSMAPKRMSKILSDIQAISPDTDIDNIGDYLANVVTLKSDIISSLSDLKSRFTGNKSPFLHNVELLIHENLLILGKKFYCPICESELWFHIDDIRKELKCCYCNNRINLPVVYKGGIIQESVRLNELLIDSIDQGQFSMLLVNEIIKKQSLRNRKVFYNLDLYQNDILSTDIDILLIMNDLIGFFEVKSNRIFNLKQSLTLIELSELLEIDFIVFSSLLSRDCDEINCFVTALEKIKSSLSIIILTKDILFSDNKIQFKDYLNKGVIVI